MTVFGNPYALLLYTVGEDWKDDPTFKQEEGCVQCYTPRFKDNEYLGAFRNPQNSPNNICYLHNVHNDYFERYFEFSNNIMAVNCIGTDIQDRANGMDFDSDFMLVTNQKEIVKAAKICYENYPTVVNDLKESGITYSNTKTAYSNMDNKFSGSQMGIGWSSNLAQLAMTYYWTELAKENQDESLIKELYDNFTILAVLAQVEIDSSKREYEVNGRDEIKRISKLPCMSLTKTIEYDDDKFKTIKCDFPEFMRYTREIPHTKDGKELPYETVSKNKSKLRRRINPDLQCPMNWLEEWLDKIQNISSTNTIPTKEFFIKMQGEANRRQMSAIMKLVKEYDNYVKCSNAAPPKTEDEYVFTLIEKADAILEKLQAINVKNVLTINRLVEVALGLSCEIGASHKRQYDPLKYTRKLLNLLYKSNKNRFLDNFIVKNTQNLHD